MEEKKSFLGTGWGFPPTFIKGLNGVVMISDEEDIKSSLEILLTTTVGERILQPKYGCDLSKYVFDPLDTTLKTVIKTLIEDAILFYEPRILVDQVELEDNPNEGILLIKIDYTIATTNTRYNFVFPFYLVEGTNIQS